MCDTLASVPQSCVTPEAIMAKFFNTTGPCRGEDHYMIDPLNRLGDIRKLVDDKLYFVVHAPRQTGKTTTLESLATALTAEGKYTALKFSCETGQPLSSDIESAEDAIIQAIIRAAKNTLPPELQCPQPVKTAKGTRIGEFLSEWATTSSRPLVLFFDEIDALMNNALESVLRQLRAGFSYRPHAFPQSIVLCGLRDVRDYKVLSGGQPRLGTPSPFNIKSDSLRLANFTETEVRELYLQHTAATGQQFEPEAMVKAWELTDGQPWLVNALANQTVAKMGIPRSQTITTLDIEKAAQEIILARQTHLDSLVDKLTEERVQRVVEPVLAGLLTGGDMTYNDDISYVRDLGLIAPKSPIRIANPIYREVIVRVLAARAADVIDFERKSFVSANGMLDVDVIVKEFATWWRENAEFMLSSEYYNEAAAQLVFMAWLQRVVNGGGIIDREYGVGRGRIDILVRWPHPAAAISRDWQREAFELKVWRDGRPDPLTQGLTQLEAYLEKLGLTQGTLVIFDRRKDALPPATRTQISQAQTPKGYAVRLLRA
jgi:type II secretory pathway predicted ATPase ExeA